MGFTDIRCAGADAGADLAPVCSLLILTVVLCAGDLFRKAEILRFSFSVRAVSSKNLVVCIGEDLLCHWF